MITRSRFRPRKIWPYVRSELTVVLVMCTGILGAHASGVDVGIPFLPLGMLGTAVAIAVGFRNNAAYARWWEARTAWTTIQSASLQYARLVVTFTRSHVHKPGYNVEASSAFIDQSMDQHREYLIRLAEMLRTPPDGQADVMMSTSLYLVERGHAIYQAMASGVLQGFDSFQLEGALAQIQSAVATCEKIRSTPLARQFTVFTSMFVWIVLLITPFALASIMLSVSYVGFVVLAGTIAFAFTILDKAGRVTENPFAGTVHDVPMTAICRDITRELERMKGSDSLLPRLIPRDGVLS